MQRGVINLSVYIMQEISLFGVGANTTDNAVAVAGNVDITGNLGVRGNLSIFQFTANKTITTTNYQLVVAEDISLNGRVIGSSDASFGGNLWVGGTTGITVTGAITAGSISSGTTATTQTSTDNSTKLATTAYVQNQGYLTSATASSTYAPKASPTFTGTLTLSAGGTLSLPTSSVTNAMLANSAITIGSTSISLGTTATTLTGVTLASPSFSGTLSSMTLSNPTFTGTLTFPATSVPNSALQGSGTMTIAGTSVALGGSISQATICSGYATTASLSSYATTASLSSYATTASLSSYAPLANATHSGTTTFPGSTVINSSGYIGIGKTGPGYALDIVGSTQLTNTSTGSFNNFYGKVPPSSSTYPSTVKPNTTSATSSAWTNNGITWSASQSSAASEINNNTFYPYNSNISSGNIWTSLNKYSNSSPYNAPSGASTTIISIGTVFGEWTQIQSSLPVTIFSYQVACGSHIVRAPSKFYIVGSNDGSIWFPIQYVVTPAATNPYTATYSYPSNNPTILANNQYAGTAYGGSSTITTTTYGSYTTQAYTYFRMITTNIYGDGVEVWVGIAEWNITFNPSTSTGPSRTLLYMDASNINQLDVSGSLALVNSNTSLMMVRPNTTAATGHIWNNNNVTWSAISSSSSGASQLPYLLFNTNNADNGWANGSSAYSTSSPYNYTAGTYSTTITGIGATAGEWVQLQSSIPVIMTNYSFFNSNSQTPATYYICGSNDNLTWYPLLKAVATQVTGQTSVYTIPSGTTSTSGTVSNITYNSYGYGSTAYTYFRLVITHLTSTGDGRVFFYEWNPTFTPASSGASLALDAAVPNQLNIGGSLGIAGGITPTYSTPVFGPGQVGYQVVSTTNLIGSAAVPHGTSAIVVTVPSVPPGVYLVIFRCGTNSNGAYAHCYIGNPTKNSSVRVFASGAAGQCLSQVYAITEPTVFNGILDGGGGGQNSYVDTGVGLSLTVLRIA